MTVWGWVLLALAVAVLVFAGVFGWLIGRRLFGVHMRRRTLAEHRRFIAPFTEIRTPSGEGPFAAVVLLHGCGGRRRIMDDYAETAVRAGFAAVIVDSLAPRGLGYVQALAQVCTGRRLWARERAADLHAGLEIARADPRIDPERLALAGWSHGAWTILDALVLAGKGAPPDGIDAAPDAPFAGVKAILAFYPYCKFPALCARRTGIVSIPIDAVLVQGDTVASERAAIAALTLIRQAGGQVRWRMMKGVTHGFDEPDHHALSLLRHDAAGAKIARAHFVDFLNEHLGPGAACG